ncbi:leucine-rich repeat-containing protein 1-like isoform X2 [Linepithema humile]
MRCNLKSLEITYYDLFQLPLQITCLKNLTTLYMTRMRISSLPKEFGNLPLVDLDLSYNNLRKSEQFSWEWSMQAPIRHTLRYLNLSHNYIKFIPKELGTLPHLMCLNLSSNHLGKSDCNTWEWLEQTAIRIRLCDLNLSDNLLMELPPQIGKLNTLFFLNLKCNKLKYLPQSLANLKNLTFLDLSDNDLLYLPGSIAQSWAFINVNGNPFNLDDDSYDNSTTNLEVPSLLDCSAEIFLKYRLNYTNGLPQELVKYLDNKRYCFFCVTPCFRYYGKRFINYLKYKKILNPKFIPVLSLHIEKAKFECYACSSECAKRLKFD